MIRRQLIHKTSPRSLIQWNEEEGDYQVKCPRCNDELSAPTLTTIRNSFRLHYKTEECKAHY